MKSASRAPAAAASVAVNRPAYMPPSTNTGSDSAHSALRTARSASPRLARGSRAMWRCATAVLTMLQAANTPAMSRPGRTPAMNRPPIEVSVVTP